jgi:hypothetical protein
MGTEMPEMDNSVDVLVAALQSTVILILFLIIVLVVTQTGGRREGDGKSGRTPAKLSPGE